MGNATSQIFEKLKDFMSVFKTDKQISLTILGLDAAGKSTLVNLLNGNNMPTVPTLGFNHDEIKIDKTTIRLWDVGGQKALMQFWSEYVKNTDGLIFVIDIADKDRFAEAFNAFKVLTPHLRENTPVLLLLNKTDLIRESHQIRQRIEDVSKMFGCDENAQVTCGGMSVDGKKYRAKILDCSVVDSQNKMVSDQRYTLSSSNIYSGFRWVMKVSDGKEFL